MCEACVSEERVSQQVYDFIEAFCDLFPQSRYGPGHNAIDDLNLADGDLRYCLRLAQLALNGDSPELDEEERGHMQALDWYKDHDRAELEATAKFLEILLLIPEDDR